MKHYEDVSIGDEGAMIINGIPKRSGGDVDIGNDVVFQKFVSVKRGLNPGESTIIGDGTYISSFVNIGHNCKIGKNCFLAPGVILSGYVELGDNVYIGINSSVVQHIKIGNWCKIRAGSLVDVDIPNNTYFGKGGKMVENNKKPRNLT